MAVDVSVRPPRLPCWLGEPFVPLLASGVGSSGTCRAAIKTTRSFKAIPPVRLSFVRAPAASRARGVGSSFIRPWSGGGQLEADPQAVPGGDALAVSPRAARWSCRPRSALAAVSRMLPASGKYARMKTRSRRWGAPTSEARRLVQFASYPSAARSPSTRPRPLLRRAATFSTTTSFGRSTRMPSAMVSQSPLRVPYAMRNAGPAAGETDVLAGKPGTQDVDRIELVPVDVADVAEVRDSRMTLPAACSRAGRCRPPMRASTEHLLRPPCPGRRSRCRGSRGEALAWRVVHTLFTQAKIAAGHRSPKLALQYWAGRLTAPLSGRRILASVRVLVDGILRGRCIELAAMGQDRRIITPGRAEEI
jgi:hypothetical protein